LPDEKHDWTFGIKVREVLPDEKHDQTFGIKCCQTKSMTGLLELRWLKVENSKFVFQNACTEISLAKAEADNFAKLEEVKLLQFVINLLTPEYSGKNNQSDLYVKGGLIDALHGKKNDISTSSIIDTPDSPIQGEKTSDNQSYLLLWQMRFW
ncbi:hypothetical protein RclHR1_08040001, partial [Rhizophagus clarus]